MLIFILCDKQETNCKNIEKSRDFEEERELKMNVCYHFICLT